MSMTINEVLQRLPSSPIPLEHSVDQLLYGDGEMVIHTAAVTFTASQHILEQAVRLAIPLIITHEGLFYSHHHVRPQQHDHDMFLQKEHFIHQHKLAVYRYHDHCHRHLPDLITRGLVNKLSWQQHIAIEKEAATIVQLPAATALRQLITYVKTQLQLPYVRYRGELDHRCERIGVLVGYRGNGSTLIPLIAQQQLDAVIIGEGMEWEAPEYIRDAALLGKPCAIIVLGHAESEIPGIELIADILQKACPQLTIHHLQQDPIYTVG